MDLRKKFYNGLCNSALFLHRARPETDLGSIRRRMFNKSGLEQISLARRSFTISPNEEQTLKSVWQTYSEQIFDETRLGKRDNLYFSFVKSMRTVLGISFQPNL